MAYWLFKSEPSTWGWPDQVAKGDAGEEWDGVRNYQARNFMREMAVGDLGFFYHSQGERAIVGIVEVCAAASRPSRGRRRRISTFCSYGRDSMALPRDEGRRDGARSLLSPGMSPNGVPTRVPERPSVPTPGRAAPSEAEGRPRKEC